MLELTGFPGIEVIASLCFTLLLITWLLRRWRQERKITVSWNELKIRQANSRGEENTKGLGEVAWCCLIWHIYTKNFDNFTDD